MTKLTTGKSPDRPKPADNKSRQPNKQPGTQQETGKTDQNTVVAKASNTTARLKELESRLTEKLPIDTQRINEMKNAIANGEYEVDAERIANKMIDFETSLKK